MPSNSSAVVHSVGMENMRPPAAADVPSATPTAIVSLAVVDVPDDVDNGQDKDDSFWSKKCIKCPLFGHTRSSSHMCLKNPNNAHRCVYFLTQLTTDIILIQNQLCFRGESILQEFMWRLEENACNRYNEKEGKKDIFQRSPVGVTIIRVTLTLIFAN